MTEELAALLKAHIAAAAAWRRMMDARGEAYGSTEYEEWVAAERLLTTYLGREGPA